MPLPDSFLIARRPVVPILTLHDVSAAIPLARALAAGGLDVIEITLRTPAALEAIARIASDVPEVLVGAGTVRTAQDIDRASAAGAQFLVSPGATSALLDAAAESPLPFLPGAATASEVMALAERGFRLLKFFPAEPSGGRAFLKSLAAPFPDVRFCPTGGIGANEAAAYLALSNVACVGGSWVAPEEAARSGDFASIATLARAAAALRASAA